MRSNTLEKSESVANAIACMRRQGRRGEERVDGDYLLQQRGDGGLTVPQNRGEVGKGLTLLAELEKSVLALKRATVNTRKKSKNESCDVLFPGRSDHERVDALPLHLRT